VTPRHQSRLIDCLSLLDEHDPPAVQAAPEKPLNKDFMICAPDQLDSQHLAREPERFEGGGPGSQHGCAGLQALPSGGCH
jgi:hypothetical protein